MINFKQFEEQPIFDPEEIHAYGDAVRFAYSVFNFFNGKVNPHFPAHAMILSDSIPRITLLGQAIGDVVILYSHHIMYYTKIYMKENKPDKLKGTLVSTIIHELLHMEQDLQWYYNKYKGYENADKRIEDSCHAMTTKYISEWCGYDIWHLDYVNIITGEFPNIDYDEYDKNKMDMLLSNVDKIFKRVLDPTAKALWILDNCIFKDNKSVTNMNEWLDDGHDTLRAIYAKIIINGVSIKENYILYNSVWGTKDVIMDIARTLFLIGISNPGMTQETKIGKYGSGSYALDIYITPNNPNSYINIVDRVEINSIITPYI